MADLTAAQIDSLIESTRSALATALADPRPNYAIGDRRVDYASYIKILREQLTAFRAMKADIPAESLRDFDYDITDTGEDNTEYEGESTT